MLHDLRVYFAVCAVVFAGGVAIGTEFSPFFEEEEDVGAMTITSAITRLDVSDDDGVGAVDIAVHYRLTTDSAEAIAMGAQHRIVAPSMECLPRNTCVNAIATLINNSLITNDGGWPEGAIALPRPRK